MSAGFVKQSCQIQRGRSAANHYDVATPKRRDLAMAGAVREKLLGQMRQVLRNIIEMGDADRQHYRPGMNRLTILELQHESAGQPTNVCYQLIFQLRHHAIPEGEPISRESFKPHWNAGIGVLDAAFCTKLPQGKRVFGVVDVGSEAVGLQHHALRHVGQPAVHWTTENAEWNAITP